MTDHGQINSSSVKKLWPALAIVASFGAIALLLPAQGRLWLCACGRVLLWSGNICSSDNSQHFFDPYSFTHILHGFAFFWLIKWLTPRLRPAWQLALAVAFEAAWEVFENTNFIIDRYRTTTAALGYTGDTVINSFGDTICCLLGFLIARWLGVRRSIVVFFVLELILILWIRDSLLLEIVMLTFPIDAIKALQLCG